MKKILALVLAMMLVLSMSAVAFAADEESGSSSDSTTTALTAASKAATYNTVVKNYTVTGADTTAIYPTETLKFTSTAATTNPDGGSANLTINDLVVVGQSNTLTINVPSFTEVGTYHFTIKETAGTAQGVTYTTEEIAVSVLVTYDYEDTDKDGYTMTAAVGITSNGTAKDNELTNEYKLGSLAVTKQVTGNLGDTSKVFNVDVTFTATNDKHVESAITYVDDGATKTIEADWTGSKEVTITLKHGETVTFIDIPDGVTYTVVEQDYTTGEKNGENGYDAPTYNFSDTTKTIANQDKDTVGITNNKSTNVDTGISVDSLPYVIIMGLVVLAGAAMLMKKRSYND